MRCFVAVSVGARIAEEVSTVAAGLRRNAEDAGVKISWSLPEGWHATLKFLGEIDEARVEAVRVCLRAVVGLAPFPVEATGVITLPVGARVPSVIAVRLSDDGHFTRLARTLDDAMTAAGFERESRGFLPHLTLGRVRAARGWRTLVPQLERLSHRRLGNGEVSAMTLYRSHLGAHGARYEALETFALDAPAPPASAPGSRDQGT